MRAIIAAVGLLSVLAASPARADEPVSVTIDSPPISTTIGAPFGFGSEVTNDTDHELSGLVAHLDVVSTRPEVYVDPEDWSPRRTIYLPPVPPHSSRRIDWSGRVVNEGDFVLYVVVTATGGPAGIAASPGVRLHAEGRRTLDAGGVLPVVIGMPALMGALLALVGVRRRRLRTVRAGA